MAQFGDTDMYHHWYGSSLARVMACCLTASSHYPYQCSQGWFLTMTMTMAMTMAMTMKIAYCQLPQMYIYITSQWSNIVQRQKVWIYSQKFFCIFIKEYLELHTNKMDSNCTSLNEYGKCAAIPFIMYCDINSHVFCKICFENVELQNNITLYSY